MNDIFYVYELIDPFTNIPFYVGKGKGNRMYDHEKEVKRGIIPHNNKHLYYKIKKILNENNLIIYKKIIENIDQNTAWTIESDLIKKYGRKNDKLGTLCNLTDGGEGASGLIYTEKMRELRRKLFTGNKNPMYGKNHSNNTKKIISEKRRNRIWNFHHSENHKRKLKIDNPGGKATSYPIIQLDINGNFLKEWRSIREASKMLNLMEGSICNSAKKLITYKNFIWVYKKNYKDFDISEVKIRDGVKKLMQFDIRGNMIKEWPSIKEAISNFNCKLSPSMITWSNKNNKQYKGYFWKIYE